MPRPQLPAWLTRLEMLGTTLTVLIVGGTMIWYEAVEQGPRLAVTIGSAVVLYAAALVFGGRRSDPHRIAWWPFALAGAGAGAVSELINAQFVVTRELLVAALTGVVVGMAHWVALWVWIRLNERRPA